jgi:hypothetical protein
VASRWALEDDDAAFLMERWYEALRTGETASAALRQARREAREAGRPAEAWAGLVLLGDGQVRPLLPDPSSVWQVGSFAAAIIATLMTAAAVGSALWIRR